MRYAVVTALIERGQAIEYKTFRAPMSITRLKRLIRQTWTKKEGVTRVSCGNGIYQNQYGAH